MSLFDKLLSLHGDSVPLEDFFTEIVAHLLVRHPELCERWLASLGVLEQGSGGSAFSVRTQTTYAALDHHEQNSRPDMEIEVAAQSQPSSVGRVFVESKIGSGEGPQQLRRYAEHLSTLAKAQPLALVYVTRDYDPKEAEEITAGLGGVRYVQSRWSEFYRTLDGYRCGLSSQQFENCTNSTDNLIVEVMEFMEERGLSRDHRLTGTDLEAIYRLPRTLSLLEETVSSAGDMLQPLSGRKPRAWGSSLRTIREHGFYTVLSTLGPDESWYAGIGYIMNPAYIRNWVDPQGSDFPAIRATIEMPPSNTTGRIERIEAFRRITDEFGWRPFHLDTPDQLAGVILTKSLAEILPQEDHVATIRSFFQKATSDMYRMKEAYPYLPWSSES